MNVKIIPLLVVGLCSSATVSAQSFQPIDNAAVAPQPIATNTNKMATTPSSEVKDVVAPSSTKQQGAIEQSSLAPTTSLKTQAQPARRPKSQQLAAPAVPEVLTSNGKIERVVFDRRPVNVTLATGRERMIHLPYEVAVQIPADADPALEVQIIGTTAYIHSASPIGRTRVVAQGMNGEGFIPLDISVRNEASSVPDELEVFLKPSPAGSASPSSEAEGDDEDIPAPDMVQMTRYCLQQVYAPQRLIRQLPGVRQVDIKTAPVAGLYRGGAIQTTPIGAWRSSDQYVTAVRLTNRSSQPIELDMEQLRGHWSAATPQHWRLLASGSEADTTVTCLVSEQPFDAAR